MKAVELIKIVQNVPSETCVCFLDYVGDNGKIVIDGDSGFVLAPVLEFEMNDNGKNLLLYGDGIGFTMKSDTPHPMKAVDLIKILQNVPPGTCVCLPEDVGDGGVVVWTVLEAKMDNGNLILYAGDE